MHMSYAVSTHLPWGKASHKAKRKVSGAVRRALPERKQGEGRAEGMVVNA